MEWTGADGERTFQIMLKGKYFTLYLQKIFLQMQKFRNGEQRCLKQRTQPPDGRILLRRTRTAKYRLHQMQRIAAQGQRGAVIMFRQNGIVFRSQRQLLTGNRAETSDTDG